MVGQRSKANYMGLIRDFTSALRRARTLKVRNGKRHSMQIETKKRKQSTYTYIRQNRLYSKTLTRDREYYMMIRDEFIRGYNISKLMQSTQKYKNL